MMYKIFLQEHREFQVITNIMQRYAFLLQKYDRESDFIYKMYACMYNFDKALVVYKKQVYADLMSIDTMLNLVHALQSYSCSIEKLNLYCQVMVNSLDYLFAIDQYQHEQEQV